MRRPSRYPACCEYWRAEIRWYAQHGENRTCIKIKVVVETFFLEHYLLDFLTQEVQACIAGLISEVSAEVFHDLCPRIALLTDPVAESHDSLSLLECVSDPFLSFADIIDVLEHPQDLLTSTTVKPALERTNGREKGRVVISK